MYFVFAGAANSYPILNISVDCDKGSVRINHQTQFMIEGLVGKRIVDVILEYNVINTTTNEVVSHNYMQLMDTRIAIIYLKVSTEHIARDSLKYLEQVDLPVTLSDEFSYQFEACMAFQYNPCWIGNTPILYCNNNEVENSNIKGLGNIHLYTYS